MSMLKVGVLTADNFTSETAAGIARNLASLTSGQKLTSDEVEAGNAILDGLVTLQEAALEGGRNFTTSDDYIDVSCQRWI